MKFERIWTNGSSVNLMEFYCTGVFGELRDRLKSSKFCGWRSFYGVFLSRCSEQHVEEPVGGIKVLFSAESASFALASFDESACLSFSCDSSCFY
ncbi:hypothetical protein CEXT_264431 [Caerostris extrusa]|uniref:Uncharacterized protein n=1 Tax=Caerostris extrusa TaxID=172846 RepID=A0AAV4RR37_CAEEX|nr:hypothetical protein CEXT_264431 [Caerostris extrusa]